MSYPLFESEDELLIFIDFADAMANKWVQLCDGESGVLPDMFRDFRCSVDVVKNAQTEPRLGIQFATQVANMIRLYDLLQLRLQLHEPLSKYEKMVGGGGPPRAEKRELVRRIDQIIEKEGIDIVDIFKRADIPISRSTYYKYKGIFDSES